MTWQGVRRVAEIRVFCGGRWQWHRTLTSVCALIALLVALLAAPTAASACPAFAKEKAFHGTASSTFDQTASESSDGSTTTITLDRVADGLQFPKLTPVKIGKGEVSFSGGPEGGSIGVNDVYYNGATSGGQTANGPTLPYPSAGKGEIAFLPAKFGCVYSVVFSFAIATTSIGDWPYGPSELDPDLGVTGLAAGPVLPIPKDLKLSGTATIPWEGEPNSGKGFYRGSGFLPHDAWVTAFRNVLGNSGTKGGLATISWSFSPTKAECVVPKLDGKTLVTAKNALISSGCTLGKVTSKTSFTVPKGRVISSSPPAGKKLSVGAKVDLTISRPPCVVPPLAGVFAYQAPNLLKAANCALGTVTKKDSVTVPKGKVISSSPKEGSKLSYGADVALAVSNGPPKCIVPYLAGEPLSAAKLKLGQQGCKTGTITYQKSSMFTSGDVISSSPKAGKKLPLGSAVALAVSSGP